MRLRRIIGVVCLFALGCVAVVIGINVWHFVGTRLHAKELSEEQGRALDAHSDMGGGGASYITAYASWGVFNQIDFNFRDRELNDNKLKHRVGLTGVVGLDLSENPITDEGLRYVGEVPHLQWLQLSDTNITDRGIEHLRDLKHLRCLDLTGTRITQEAASVLAEIPQLEIVYARRSRLREVQGVTVNRLDEQNTWIRDCIAIPLRQELP